MRPVDAVARTLCLVGLRDRRSPPVGQPAPNHGMCVNVPVHGELLGAMHILPPSRRMGTLILSFWNTILGSFPFDIRPTGMSVQRVKCHSSIGLRLLLCNRFSSLFNAPSKRFLTFVGALPGPATVLPLAQI